MDDHFVNTKDNHQDFNPNNTLSEPKGYAVSGRIMLSAIIILFSVVIIMICLHVYARWYILRARRRQIRRARRRTHLVFYIEPDNPTSIIPIASHGLDTAVLKSLPTFTYPKAPHTAEEEVLECAVCLSEFEVGEKGRLLPKCKHCFHVECIDMWFHSHATCPLCRAPVDYDDVMVGDEVAVELGELTQSQLRVSTELTQSQLEVGAELTQSQLGVGAELTRDVGASQGESEGTSSSISGRRKGGDLVGVSIEVPPRRSQSFCFGGSNSDESGPSRSPRFKSPTSRIMSLKRILSRENKSPLPSPSGAGSSCCELDVEFGRVDSSSQTLTPR